ncbi:uncharacterized protein LOC143305796 [Osmia lignaria lignaria]|uniref:uncharacterized protein LOC143305796 n=1 Tax=Osmia lignaria lignaria TaxID=1437193 RepID=UPI00402B6366
MLRGLASRCLEPVSPKGHSSRERVKILANTVTRRTYERRRRSGDGRKRDAFEERSAANQEEYFRRETARQLKELRERLQKRKAENDAEREGVKRRRSNGQAPDKSSVDDSDHNREN